MTRRAKFYALPGDGTEGTERSGSCRLAFDLLVLPTNEDVWILFGQKAAIEGNVTAILHSYDVYFIAFV